MGEAVAAVGARARQGGSGLAAWLLLLAAEGPWLLLLAAPSARGLAVAACESQGSAGASAALGPWLRMTFSAEKSK